MRIALSSGISQKKSRKAGRSVKNLLSSMLFLGIAIMMFKFQMVYGIIERNIPNPEIQTISLASSGASKVSKAEVLEILQLPKGQSIREFDIFAAQQKLKQHPWIENVSIRKIYPYMLEIFIEDSVPEAIFVSKEGKFLISKSGKIIHALEQVPKDSPYIILFGEKAIKKYKEISQKLYHTKLYSDILSLSFVGNRRWDIYLKSKITLKMPAEFDDTLFPALEKILSSQKDLKMIDLRLFPSKIYMKYHAETKK